MIQPMTLNVHSISDLAGRSETPRNPPDADYGSVGWGFDSSWLHQFPSPSPSFLGKISTSEQVTTMTLKLTLPPDIEKRLQHEAERQGLPTVTLTLQLLDQHPRILGRSW
jgi:hypothetical protein